MTQTVGSRKCNQARHYFCEKALVGACWLLQLTPFDPEDSTLADPILCIDMLQRGLHELGHASARADPWRNRYSKFIACVLTLLLKRVFRLNAYDT